MIYANILYDLAENAGSNWDVIKEGIGSDPRIGRSHLDVIHASWILEHKGEELEATVLSRILQDSSSISKQLVLIPQCCISLCSRREKYRPPRQKSKRYRPPLTGVYGAENLIIFYETFIQRYGFSILFFWSFCFSCSYWVLFWEIYFGPDGKFGFWDGNIWGVKTLREWQMHILFTHYSWSTFLWFSLARGSKIPLQYRFLIALVIEGGWNYWKFTHYYQCYHEATISLGYVGDSILNSVSDVGMMAIGFCIARTVRIWVSIAIIVIFEVGCLLWVRDNLTLNVLMLVHPVSLSNHGNLNDTQTRINESCHFTFHIVWHMNSSRWLKTAILRRLLSILLVSLLFFHSFRYLRRNLLRVPSG